MLIFVFCFYGLRARSNIHSPAEFFTAGHSLSAGWLSTSFASASTSLASVFFFFVVIGQDHGLWALWAPITYFLGVWFFANVLLPRIEHHGFFDADQRAAGSLFSETLGGYVQQRYGSRIIHVSVLLFAIAGLMAILLIEMYVGVQIFRLYAPEWASDAGLLLVVACLFFYVGFGGMRAVVWTDRIQLYVMGGACIAIIIWLSYMVRDKNLGINMGHWLPHPFVFEGGVMLPYALLINMTVVNFLMLPALLRTWQMAASASDSKSIKKGMYWGAVGTAVVTLFLLVIGILFYRELYPAADPSLISLLQHFAISPDWMTSHVLLPMLFIACLSALFSTADSALLPILQALWYDVGGNKVKAARTMKNIWLLHVLVMGVAVALYFIVFRLLGFDLISWLFTIFSFLIVVAPAVIMGIILEERLLKSPAGTYAAMISMVGGFVLAVSLSLIGVKTGRLELVQLNSPIAALVGFSPFFALWAADKRLFARRGG